jgi:hypothetical protein
MSIDGDQIRSMEASAALVSAGAAGKPAPLFFPVSPGKLLLMSVCTVGLYEFYWFYKNWHLVKAREKSSIDPYGRAFFCIFFCSSLFRRVEDAARDAKVEPVRGAAMALGWLVFTLISLVTDPFGLLSFAAILFLLPVQGAVNRINAARAPGHEANDRYSGWNLAVMACGVLCYVMVITMSDLLTDKILG